MSRIVFSRYDLPTPPYDERATMIHTGVNSWEAPNPKYLCATDAQYFTLAKLVALGRTWTTRKYLETSYTVLDALKAKKFVDELKLTNQWCLLPIGEKAYCMNYWLRQYNHSLKSPVGRPRKDTAAERMKRESFKH